MGQRGDPGPDGGQGQRGEPGNPGLNGAAGPPGNKGDQVLCLKSIHS